MNFLSPFSLLWLAPIGGVIVALYLLKLRRRDEIVSSVFLWNAVVQDTQANAPFQKLRKNLLLLLQLLIAAFLVFTVARPFLWASGLGGRTSAIVIDGSASMKATDEPGSRFDKAVADARALLKQKAPGDQALVILAGDKPTVLSPLTADRDKLLKALDQARPTDATGDMREAIQLAASMVSSRAQAEVTVLSDGVFEKTDELTLGGAKLQFLPVGKRSENVGITAFDVRDALGGGEGRQAFVTVQNFGKTARRVPLEIRVGSTLVDAHELDLVPGQIKSETFDAVGKGVKEAANGSTVTARLDARDDLAADDTAAITLAPRRHVRILLVTEGNVFLENALNLDARVELSRVAPADLLPSFFARHDLAVFDNVAPPKDLPPGGRYLFWGAAMPPAGSPARADFPVSVAAGGAEADRPQILDWSRTHPAMRFVDLANVHLRTAKTISPAPWATTLAETDRGALIVAGEKGDGRSVYVGFSVFDSDMPLRIAFPIFLSNCVQWLTARPGDTSGVFKAGDVVPLGGPTQTATVIDVKRPDGKTDTVRPAPGTPALYDHTNQVGIYTATGEKGAARTFAVSLLSPGESNIAPVAKPVFVVADAADLGDKKAAASPGARVPVRREIWPWIAALALAVLSVEWFVYHRRLG